MSVKARAIVTAICFWQMALVLSGCALQSATSDATAVVGQTAPAAQVETPTNTIDPSVTPGTLEQTRIRWQKTFVGHAPAAPAVAKGIVYSTADFCLCAYDGKTGAELWRLPIKVFEAKSPIVVDDVIYFTGAGNAEISTLDRSAAVYAVDANRHDVKWKFLVSDEDVTATAFATGTLYFAGAPLSLGGRGYGGHVYALDANTGRLRWSISTPLNVRETPLIADGLVYFGDGGRYLYGVEAQTGREAWTYEALATGTTSPIMLDQTLYFLSGDPVRHNVLYAVDSLTRQQKWTFERNNSVLQYPTVQEGKVLLAANQASPDCTVPADCVVPDSTDNYLYALDAQTGKESWRLKLRGRGEGSPIQKDGMVYLEIVTYLDKLHISLKSDLVALDANDRQEKWSYTAHDSDGFGVPSIADGMVYIGEWGNEFIALDAR